MGTGKTGACQSNMWLAVKVYLVLQTHSCHIDSSVGKACEKCNCPNERRRVILELALRSTSPNSHPPLFFVLTGCYNVVNLGWPGMLYLDQAGFRLRDLPLPLNDWTIFPDRVE